MTVSIPAHQDSIHIGVKSAFSLFEGRVLLSANKGLKYFLSYASKLSNYKVEFCFSVGGMVTPVILHQLVVELCPWVMRFGLHFISRSQSTLLAPRLFIVLSVQNLFHVHSTQRLPITSISQCVGNSWLTLGLLRALHVLLGLFPGRLQSSLPLHLYQFPG